MLLVAVTLSGQRCHGFSVRRITNVINSSSKFGSSLFATQIQDTDQDQDRMGVNVSTKNEESDSAFASSNWKNEALSVVVVGASGDLAKKLTYPALFDLHRGGLLPNDVIIHGFARSDLSDDDLREKARPALIDKLKGDKDEDCSDGGGCKDESAVDDFLALLHYHQGEAYDHTESYEDLNKKLEEFESATSSDKSNRLFYFAVPPSTFDDVAGAIKESCMQDEDKGFSRIVMEKPFGHDLESFEKLHKSVGKKFNEEQIYRIGESELNYRNSFIHLSHFFR